MCRIHRTLLSFSVQKNVANELPAIAQFDVQTQGLRDNYVDNLAPLYFSAERGCGSFIL